jgi:hypothetical protein
MMRKMLASSDLDSTADVLFALHPTCVSSEQVSETHQYLLLVASYLVVASGTSSKRTLGILPFR